MIKNFLVSACLLLSLLTLAQEGSYSPYSYYGIGDQRFKGTAENRSMGGLTIFPDSIHLNIQNPASFSALKLTTFTVGGTAAFAKLNTETQQEKAQRAVLDYFAVGIPLGKKAGLAFGMMPFSSVGFKINAVGEYSPIETENFNSTGSGGVNRVFVGFGYSLTKNFRLGADLNYNFGKVETVLQYRVQGVEFGTRELNESELGGFGMSAGLMYEGKFNDKLKVFSGITYVPETTMHLSNYRNISTIQQTSTGGVTLVDNRDIFVGDTKIKLPSKISFGAGLGQTMKWQAGAELTFQNSKGMANRFEEPLNVDEPSDFGDATFENGLKLSVGGYYIPNFNSFSSYLSRITYRAGAKHEKTGMVLNTKSIFDTAATFGVGLPLNGTFSNINVGLEYGKRGTISHGLVEENYFNVSIGLSFNDRWFVKRRYE